MATNLFVILEDRGSSQRWLASRLGIDESYLSHVKAGRVPFPRHLQAKTAQLLGIPESVLFPNGAEQAPHESVEAVA